MPIPTDRTLERPAVSAKTYDSEWIRNLAIRATGPDDGTIYLETVAYDSTTGEIDNGIVAADIRRDDFWQIVDEVPEAAAAMQAVFAAIPAIRQWIAAQEAQP